MLKIELKKLNKVSVLKKDLLTPIKVTKFDIQKIQKLSNPKAYVYQLLKDYGFSEWNDIYDLLNAQSGKQVLSKTHRLLKDREFLFYLKTTF